MKNTGKYAVSFFLGLVGIGSKGFEKTSKNPVLLRGCANRRNNGPIRLVVGLVVKGAFKLH